MNKLNLILGISILLMINTTNAQVPFGPPPNGNKQPQTPDNFLNSTDYNIPTEGGIGGGGGGGGVCNDPILRTGNDIQLFKTANNQVFTAKAMVWDGCPAFFIGLSSGAYTLPGLQQGVPLNGTKYGKVSDPDIILSQNVIDKLSILIIYELEYKGKQTIAFEQWDYDYNTGQLTLDLPPPSPPFFIQIIHIL